MTSCTLIDDDVRELTLEKRLEVNRDAAFFCFFAVALDLLALREFPFSILVGVLLENASATFFHDVDIH